MMAGRDGFGAEGRRSAGDTSTEHKQDSRVTLLVKGRAKHSTIERRQPRPRRLVEGYDCTVLVSNTPVGKQTHAICVFLCTSAA
jgi:hypothetical protein